MDIHAITDDAALDQCGIPHARALASFAEALVRNDDVLLASAREVLVGGVGSDGLVDASATVGNFQRMVRIADGCGIPLDPAIDMLSGDFRSELGIDRFGSSANTPPGGPIRRAFRRASGRVVRPLIGPLLKLGFAARDRFGGRG